MEQPDEKRHRKQSKGKGLWVSTSSSEGTNLPRSPGIHTPWSSLSPTHLWFLWRPYYSSTTDSTIGHWWLNSMQGWGKWHLKFQDTNPVVGFPSNNQLPSFAVIQSHLINRKDTFILGNSQGFRSSVPRRVDKEYIVIIISYNITRPQWVLFSSYKPFELFLLFKPVLNYVQYKAPDRRQSIWFLPPWNSQSTTKFR